MLKGIWLLCCGLLFIGLGLQGWRHRREARISLIEVAILKAADADPLPLNKWDRAMAFVHPVPMLIFGPAMVFLGLVVLLV